MPPGYVAGLASPDAGAMHTHTRDFLAPLWPLNVVNTCLVCGFLFLTGIMDPTDGNIPGWVEVGYWSFRTSFALPSLGRSFSL